MFTVDVCPVTQSFSFGRVMPPLQQKSRVLHVVTDNNKQRTTLKARRNLWHFQTQTKNRDIQSLGKLKGSAEAAGRPSLDAVNMMDRTTVRWGTGMIGVEIYPSVPGWLGSSNSPHSSLPISPDAATRLGLGWPWWWRGYDFSKRREFFTSWYSVTCISSNSNMWASNLISCCCLWFSIFRTRYMSLIAGPSGRAV